MSKEKDTLMIQERLLNIHPDRTQYKQYGIELGFEDTNVLVSVPVPSSEVTIVPSKDSNGEDDYTNPSAVVLSLDGLTSMTGAVADAIDALHAEHLEQRQKGIINKR